MHERSLQDASANMLRQTVTLATAIFLFSVQNVAGSGNSEVKHKAFREVCSEFLPVFRFFFMENFPDPARWFQARLAYTRSVATTSIGI